MVKGRLLEFLKYIDLGQTKFEEKVGLSRGLVNNIKGSISTKSLKKIEISYPELNTNWLLNGEGAMLKDDSPQVEIIETARNDSKLIPFYDDVVSMGGNNDIAANTDGASQPAEYIDAGDWFREATAAIRHYGESMVEYPTGCILALKEVVDRELIIPGRDYMIETSEYRVTKRIQRGKEKDYIKAYSTNTETYADGQLIHEPFDIPWRAVVRISLVLGYVVKKNGGTIVYSSKK